MPEAAVKPTEEEAITAAVVDLATLLGRIVHNFKQQRGGPPPEAVASSFEANSLGPRHGPVLIAVSLAGPLSVSEVADRIGLSVATTSLLVGELSRAGLVERSEDERDRRRTIVSLGGEHRETIEAWTREAIIGPMRRALERLSPRARSNLLQGLRTLAEESEPGAPG